MSKSVRIHKIKSNSSYEISEVSELLGVSKQTVRAWILEGLHVLNTQRPYLILGFKLKAFLEERQAKRTHILKPGQFSCFKCKGPKFPLGMMADFVPCSSTSGRLTALCEDCGTVCTRFANEAKLEDLSQILEIKIMPVDEPKGTQATPFKT